MPTATIEPGQVDWVARTAGIAKGVYGDVDKYIEIAKIHGFDDIVKELDKPWMEYVINGNPPLKGEGLPKYQSVKVPNRFNSI